ncbi:MAG: acyltransferase [Dorea sp.]|nr:acyltransferase [Dorea sp.]
MIKKIVKKITGRGNPDLQAIEYAKARGFTHGANFQYNSGYPIDGNWPWLISVGDNVTLATGVKLLAHDASTAKTGVHTKVGIVQIGNNVFIGANTVVLPNVRIGNNVIVGAGSVVTKDIPSDSVFAGNPARLICSFEEYQRKHQDNQKSHPIFRQHTWQEWPKASEDERLKMKEKLKDTFGYL